MKKHIIVITTGGTIAMKKDPETGGLVPAVSGEDLLPFPDFLTGQTFPSSNSPTCRAAG